MDESEKAQPLHDKKVAIQAEIREVRRQLDRAKELLSVRPCNRTLATPIK